MNDQRYNALKAALDDANPDKYTVLLRANVGAHKVLANQIVTALAVLGIKHRYYVNGPAWSIWATPEDAERAEWVAHRVDEDSQTWEYVQRFAVLMEHKFSLNRHKGAREGWMRMTVDEITHKLDREVQEVIDAVVDYKECPCDAHARAIALECAGVANFGVELADKVGGL